MYVFAASSRSASAFGPTNDTLLKWSLRRVAFWRLVCSESLAFCHWRSRVMNSVAAPYVSVIMMPTLTVPLCSLSSCARYACAAAACDGTLESSFRV